MKDGGNANTGTSRTGTVSGTTITLGSKIMTFGDQAVAEEAVCYDTDRNKIIITGYNASAGKLQYVVGTIDGSGNLTFTDRENIGTSASGEEQYLTYDAGNKKYIMIFRGNGGVWQITGEMAPLDAEYPDLISWSADKSVYSGGTGIDCCMVNDNNNALVMAYAANANSSRITTRTEQFRSSNLSNSGDNYIGFSKAAYTDGQTATIKVVGNVATGQVGLTTGEKYYIQGDGGLVSYYNANHAPASNVLAGTAISHDQLLIK